MCGYVQAAIAIYSAYQQSQAQRQQGAYDAAVAQYNSRVQENQATQTANQAVLAENQQRQKTAELIARQRAQVGAAGVSLSSGSPAALISDTAMLGAADAYRIKSNYQNQVTSMRQQAGLTLGQGLAKQSMMNAAATNTLLTGVAKGISSSGVADKWFKPNSSALTTQSPAPISSASWTSVG